MELININHIVVDQGIMVLIYLDFYSKGKLVLIYLGFYSKGKFLNFTQSYAKIVVLFSNLKQQKLMCEQSVMKLSGI